MDGARSGYERELDAARDAARAAASIIAGYAPDARQSWDKAEDSPVTRADLEADAAIGQVLGRAFPDDLILSEETVDAPERTERERVWIVDPLDGTKEFIEGVPQYAVSVALAVHGAPVVGTVVQPTTGECFWAARGAGAWADGERLRVSGVERLEDAVMLSSRTEMKRGQVEALRGWFAELRPIGSVAFKLALAAAGRGDLWVSTAPKSEWDVCAGHLLVAEAGGVFVTLKEGERRYNQVDVLLQPDMAAGPAALVDAFRARRQDGAGRQAPEGGRRQA